MPPVRIVGLVAGLILVAALAAAFSVLVVQMQSAVTAYAAGNSIWSRAQVLVIDALDQYAQTGARSQLQRARVWLDVPVGDLEAREAMEAAEFDYEQAQQGLLRGHNHPDDIPRMIWFFRYLSDAPYFRRAVEAWRRTDPYIRELQGLAGRIEEEWRNGVPPAERRYELRERLAAVNNRLEVHSEDFRRATAMAARWMTGILSMGSVTFLLALSLIASFLGWRLVRAMNAAERSFQAMFEQAPVGMARVGEQGQILDVNPVLRRILGYGRAALLAMRYPDLVHPDDEHLALPQRRAMVGGSLQGYTVEKRLLRGDGSSVWGRISVSRMRDDKASGARYVLILEDVSESRRLSAELNYQATHDALTDLLNRRAFEQELTGFLAHARSENACHALCFLDLDQFKIVNDTSGHVAGDDLLCQVAGVLRRTVRQGDILARLGGDEFAVILANCDAADARHVAESLRAALANAGFLWEESSYSIACSIGVVPITQDSVDIRNLLRAADIACHLSKEHGRNRVYLLREDDQELADQHGEMQWLARIRAALDEQRLTLGAQRIVRPDHPEQLRYEVLVRLQDDSGEMIPPGAFLPAAERFGAAHQIDRWVVETVCAQLSAHPAHMAALDACHINLSGRSFDQEDFADFVVATLDWYAVPPRKICFEITETAAIRNLADVTRFMERLAERGCSFALDDFGAGLSSFGYLRHLPVDCLKIDGVFVRDMATDDTDLAMVRAINDIGRTLDKTIVAEYVETHRSLELLREIGVDYVQGFAIHRPCAFPELLASHGDIARHSARNGS